MPRKRTQSQTIAPSGKVSVLIDDVCKRDEKLFRAVFQKMHELKISTEPAPRKLAKIEEYSKLLSNSARNISNWDPERGTVINNIAQDMAHFIAKYSAKNANSVPIPVTHSIVEKNKDEIVDLETGSTASSSTRVRKKNRTRRRNSATRNNNSEKYQDLKAEMIQLIESDERRGDDDEGGIGMMDSSDEYGIIQSSGWLNRVD